MAEFNKEFVHCVLDETLYGKYGYFSDNIDTLVNHVVSNRFQCYGMLTTRSGFSRSFPFTNDDDGDSYRFFYHDPEMNKFMSYHRIVTHRELSKWLSQGNGEIRYEGRSKLARYCYYELRYKPNAADRPVSNIVVRKWEDVEWHQPTAFYLGLID